MAVSVMKSSGLPEQFDLQKLVNSLVRSGATREAALSIARRVEKEVAPASDTKTIYKLAKRYLRRFNKASGMKYSLKKALFALGPAGFQFEKYFARVLEMHGYQVELNRFMEGYCVRHEVDILGSKDKKHFIIECKYHGKGGNPTDVKTALYVQSRFMDIRKACEEKMKHDMFVHQGWLVTNTRCTSDAIMYARCVGLKIVSWRYPDRESLEKLIEEKRLYPVTILPAAKKSALAALFKNGFILAQDIADMDERLFLRKSGLDHEAAMTLKKQADILCPCM